MLKLSKTVEYALISLNHINQCDQKLPISVREISDRYNIPYELLAKILQKLSKESILKSIYGPKGGYKLNNKYKSLTIRMPEATRPRQHVIEPLFGYILLVQ